LDDNGLTLKFDDGEYVDVYLNGSLLVAGDDYNTATANTISGLTALTANDILEVIVYDIYSLAKVNSEAQRTKYYKTASGGETSISGNDDGGTAITFPAGAQIDVRLNGVSLKQGADYNTNTANTVGGLTALTAGQLVEIVVYEKFVLADMVKKSGDTMTGGLSAPSITSTGGVSGTTGTFSGDLTVDRGTTHASAVVKGGNATTNYSGGSLLLANPGMATNYGGTYLYHHKAGGSGNTNAAFNISQRNALGGYVSNIWNVDYQNNAHSFYVPNGGISGGVALGIDGSGRVTMPNQPLISASITDGGIGTQGDIFAGRTLTSDTIIQGFTYNSTNGRFTAPVTGKYFVGFYSINHTAEGYVQIRRNGSSSYHAYNQAGGGNVWRTFSAFGIHSLSANDYLNFHNQAQPASHNLHGATHLRAVAYLIG
jgi:hypothetical protein